MLVGRTYSHGDTPLETVGEPCARQSIPRAPNHSKRFPSRVQKCSKEFSLDRIVRNHGTSFPISCYKCGLCLYSYRMKFRPLFFYRKPLIAVDSERMLDISVLPLSATVWIPREHAYSSKAESEQRAHTGVAIIHSVVEGVTS
jgi:hypothetical protein